MGLVKDWAWDVICENARYDDEAGFYASLAVAQQEPSKWPELKWPEPIWPDGSSEPRSPYAEFDVGLPELFPEDQDRLDSDTAEHEHYQVSPCMSDIFGAYADYDEGDGPQGEVNKVWAEMIGDYRLEWRRRLAAEKGKAEHWPEDFESGDRFHASVMRGEYLGNPHYVERFDYAYEPEK